MNQIIQELVKQAIYTVAKKAIIRAIVSKLPFLGGAIFNPILAFVIGKILDIVYEHVWRAVSFALVDFEVQTQKKAYDEAVLEIKSVLANKGATQDEIEKAKQAFKDSFDNLIKFPTK